MRMGSQNGHQELYISSQPLLGTTIYYYSETETLPKEKYPCNNVLQELGILLGWCLTVKNC